MAGKKKKILAAKSQPMTRAQAAKQSRKPASKALADFRRTRKTDVRRQRGSQYTADVWAGPAPAHLIAKLDIPKVKSKYKSYFEFADNTEKKDKKLELKVTNNPKPPPAFAFVPIGDPTLTNACKELSRERDAMIFIVSSSREEHSRINEHIHRIGYHFREAIVDEAREIVGETEASTRLRPGSVEPIPESQEEINKQADGAIRDLFPRIPNTDRQMIIEHAFRKGALFQGEPTVGLQSDLPLSRRVQLAVLAHIRHVHTRYDKLLKETTWVNARKAVEPVCLDVIVKWRGDEETGRDQMDEILREVVIITDSEDEDSSEEAEETDDDEDESTSESSLEVLTTQLSPVPRRPFQALHQIRDRPNVGTRTTAELASGLSNPVTPKPKSQVDKKAQRGFKRYQAAWEEAKHRQQNFSSHVNHDMRTDGTRCLAAVPSPLQDAQRHFVQDQSIPTSMFVDYEDGRPRALEANICERTQSGPYYPHRRPAPHVLLHRDEVLDRPTSSRPIFHEGPSQSGPPFYQIRDQGPPQVVEDSPTKHALQDMLVPSIENALADAPPSHLDERHRTFSSRDRDFHPRRVLEHRMQSPERREVIVIDDSPPMKRHRLVHEDQFGNFRPAPLHDHSHQFKPEQPASPSIPMVSTQPGESSAGLSRVPSHSSQVLFRDANSSLIDPALERNPVYDAPDAGFFTTYPSMLGRPAVRYDGEEVRREMTMLPPCDPPRRLARDCFYRRPPNESDRERDREPPRDIEYRGFRQASPDYTHGRGVQFQRTVSPQSTVSKRFSRPHDQSTASAFAEQDFIHHFSQSRLDGQGNHSVGYGGHPARSFDITPSVRARSPIRHMERPLHQWGPPHQHNVSLDRLPLGQRSLPRVTPELPTYVRTIGPKRQVVVLD